MPKAVRLAIKTYAYDEHVAEAAKRTKENGSDAPMALLESSSWKGAKALLERQGSVLVFYTSYADPEGDEDDMVTHVAELVDVFYGDDYDTHGQQALSASGPSVVRDADYDWSTVYVVRNCLEIDPFPVESLVKRNGKHAQSMDYSFVRVPEFTVRQSAVDALLQLGGSSTPGRGWNTPTPANDGKDNGAKTQLLLDEIEEDAGLPDGAAKRVFVNQYERNGKNRQACIDALGCACWVCGMDFFSEYGSVGKDFIHVHHRTPLSKIGEAHIVDPTKDLLPVCPNCHSMLHRPKEEGGECLSAEELRDLVRSRRGALGRAKQA